MNSHCMICKKPLSDYTSIRLGMGPICRARESLQSELFENHAVFIVEKETSTLIYLIDTGHNEHKTVTNDVDYVLNCLAEQYGIKGKRIFYKDSEGAIDEIIHSGNNFSHFQQGHTGVEL